MSKRIRILIADDHELVRKGLFALIDAKPGLCVVGEAADGEQAVCKASALEPDVILLDLKMPRKDGIAAIGEIKRENPDARILVLTSFGEDEQVFAAIKAGALGYLLKDSSPAELIQAIETVHRGESTLSPTIALKLVRELQRTSGLPPAENQLSEREMEVLKLVARGLANQEIGEALFISKRTVGAHVSTILNKLHLANRTQAALYALREGLSSLNDV